MVAETKCFLKNCPELEPYVGDGKDQFEVNVEHMTRRIACPISAKNLSDVIFVELSEMGDACEFTEEQRSLWLGYGESPIFSSKDGVLSRLRTYTQYLESSATAEDTKDIARAIIYELKTYPDKYDRSSILLALAQNGGVCNVQKEVGLRMVYADMTDSMLQHMESKSVETAVLTLLKKSREAACEKVATSSIRKYNFGGMNTHYLIPIRNMLAVRLGLEVIQDPNDSWCNRGDAEAMYQEFMRIYTVDYIKTVVRNALNVQPRVIDYHDCMDLFDSVVPSGVDAHEFKEQFVFDMETGHVTDGAVTLLLHKLNIIQLK